MNIMQRKRLSRCKIKKMLKLTNGVEMYWETPVSLMKINSVVVSS